MAVTPAFPDEIAELPTEVGGKTRAKSGAPLPEGTASHHSDNHNKANAEIMAIEATLGENPQGAADTVADRLDDLETGGGGGAIAEEKAEREEGDETNAAAITAEEVRAKAAEALKASKTELGTETTNREADVNAEETRAKAAEAGKEPALGFTAEDSANKDTSEALGESNKKYPSQKAVKGYVDTASGLLIPKSVIDETLGEGKTHVPSSYAVTQALKEKASKAALEAVETALAGKQVSDEDLTKIAELTTKAFGRELLTKENAAGVRSFIEAAASVHTHVEGDVTGLVADLARLNWSYRDHGFNACSVLEPATLTTSMTPEAGKPLYTRVPILTGEPNFAAIRLLIAVAGTGATSLKDCYLRVYNSTGNGLGGSSDQAANWATAGEKSVTLSADAEKSLKVAGAVGAYVWVGLLIGTQSTTPVQLAVTANSSGRINFGMAANGVPLRSATLGTGKTALPTNITPAELTINGVGAIGYGVV